ncbi:hypothetical protein HDV63DRAFT_306529 [Trichoderma sp. SZMC 28014]
MSCMSLNGHTRSRMDRHFFISLSRCFLFSHLGLIPKTTLLLAHNTKASTWTACDKSGIEANLIQTVGDSFPCLLLSSRHFLLSRHRRLSISIDRPQSVCRSMVAATQFFFPSCFTIYLFPSLNNSVLTIIKAPPSICHQHFSVSISRRLCSRLPLRLRYHYQAIFRGNFRARFHNFDSLDSHLAVVFSFSTLHHSCQNSIIVCCPCPNGFGLV